MRWVENKAWPHPVLSSTESPSNRDYVNKEFQSAYKFNITEDDSTTLNIRCNLSEESILRLIERELAAYAVEVYCQKTFLRRLFKSGQQKFKHKFARGELHGRVELSSYVVCLHDVREHSSKNLHSEFGKNAKFDFSRGDVLAVGKPDIYWWDNELLKPVSSVFELAPDPYAPANSFRLSWENEKVKILMQDETKNRFNTLRNHRTMPFLLTSVYLIAVTETLRMMVGSDEQDREKRWFRAIEHKLNKQNIQLDDSSEFAKIAQQVIDWPLSKMLDAGEKLS